MSQKPLNEPSDSPSNSTSPALPAPVLEVLDALSKQGEVAWLVGEGLADVLAGRRPSAFQVSSVGSVDSWLARFPHAVPTRPDNALLMIPTAAGPLELSAPRNGKDILGDLAGRCFTIHAVAWDPLRDQWLDPFDGRADASRCLLRTVGDPATRLAQDPIRALRAARLAATLSYRIDPALATALRGALRPLTPSLRIRVRRELVPLLLSRGAGAGIELLRSTGIEETLVPGALPDAGPVVAQLQSDLALRLAAWLRGSNAARVLARLRFGRDLAIRVQRLLRHHPVDATREPERALRRLDDRDVEALFALRRAELATAREHPTLRDATATLPSSAHIDDLAKTIAAARHAAVAARSAGRLALDGQEVMQLLGCGPGPHVGDALRHLSRCVADNPACNTRSALIPLLEGWSKPDRD